MKAIIQAYSPEYKEIRDMILAVENDDREIQRACKALYAAGYRKQSDTAREIMLLLGRGFDEVTGKDFKDLSWYKSFCRELKRRYGVEVNNEV